MSIRPAQNKLVLQVVSNQTLFKIDFKLGVDLPPVLPVSGPFFRDIHSCQIQHFQKAQATVMNMKLQMGVPDGCMLPK